MIVYEDPATADGLATAWCHDCSVGMGWLSDDLADTLRWARAHNSAKHAEGLSVRCADEPRGGRDEAITALHTRGLTPLEIARETGLRDAYAARRILARLGLTGVAL